MPSNERIAVIGAGLVGSLKALYLARKGFHVSVYERRSDIRKAEIVAGRSINLALSDRGWKALERVGMAEEIMKISIPMYARKIHAIDGNITTQAYGKDDQAIYSVSRGGLNQKLVEFADKNPNVEFNFDHRCMELDLETASLSFEHTKSGEIVERHFDRIFGTDGAFSVVRNRMQRLDRFDYSQSYLSHAYKELSIPANADGSHKLEKNALHIWPRNEYMLIALPNLDGSFTLTLFFPFEGPVSFEHLNTPEEITAFFKANFADALMHIPDLVNDFNDNPTSSMIMVKCSPWNYKDKVCILGDASHAIVPFYGQGMNAGFEDCRIFDELFEEEKGDWQNVFERFSKERKPNADAILELALRNYIEMRDKTADPDFLLQKKIERNFSDLHPDKWIPLYSQVTFSHIPYSEALKNGEKQDAIMKKVMNRPDIKEVWNSDEIVQAILKEIN